MQLQNLLSSSMVPSAVATAGMSNDSFVCAPQRSAKKQSLPAPQPSGISTKVCFESVGAGTKPMHIEVKIEPASQAHMDIPKTFEIEAINLCYKVPTPDGFLHKLYDRLSTKACKEPTPGPALIVKNVSFRAKSGEILAIVGPSGAGKSTLLELLAGKLHPSSPPSSILINQQPMDMSAFRRISGYIPQSDALFPLLSVKETLLFSAHLRLPPSISNAEKKERVDALMEELRLMHVADTRIGDELNVRGISGGERRRVSIGVDVIHDPAVLLLDEPTSGLDSASALHVVEMLHSMAKSRSRTIILSIHQPGYRIIQQINAFLLLADGCVAHHGSIQHLHHQLMVAGHKIPSQVNILEYAIEDIVSKQMRKCILQHCSSLADDKKEQKVEGHDAVAIEGYIPMQINSDKIVHTYDQGTYNGKISAPAYANNSMKEVMILAHRFSRNVFRTYELFAARCLQMTLAGLGLGLLYIHVGENVRGVVNRMGFFAFTLTFLLSSTVEALPIFLRERHVVIRETSRGAYRISSYLMANFLVFLPFLLLLALIYSAFVYWLIGLSREPSAFCFFVLVVWLVLLTANAFVAFFGTLVPDYIMGNSLISGCMGAFFLFSGYFISKQDMPAYWRFMHYISLFKYPLDALLINEYASMPGKCFGVLMPGGGGCTFTSEDVLLEMGLQNTSKWNGVLMMVMFICVYRLLCHAVLHYKVCKSST